MHSISGSIMEVILYVQDMASAVYFYRDIMGLTIRYPQNVPDYSDQMYVEFETGECTLALHAGAQDSPDNKHEIVFLVEDVTDSRAAIIAAGYPMDEVRELEDGAPIAEGTDPAGHRFAIRS